MNDILISIVVPVYNSEKYLDDCINSLLNQTYDNIEILFINDGSSDNSLNILNNKMFVSLFLYIKKTTCYLFFR